MRTPRAALQVGRALAILLVAAAIVSSMSRRAEAHTRSVSYSSFQIDDTGADVTLRVSLLELSRLGPEALPPETFSREDPLAARDGEGPEQTGDGVGAALARDLVLEANGRACPVAGTIRREADERGWVRHAWRVECDTRAGLLEIESRVLLAVAPNHLHFARVRHAGTPGAVREQVLTEASPRFRLRGTHGNAQDGASDASADGGRGDGDEEVGSRFRDYVHLGLLHILSGWDHLAFLAGLVLLAERIGAIVRLVTGFTLAHSLTLALTVLDLVHPRAAAIEAVIAFSVALVAVEKGWIVSGRRRAIPIAVCVALAGVALLALRADSALAPRTLVGLLAFSACYFALGARGASEWIRIALTFAFGLVHGFGFAGVLVELALPADRLVPALAGFNLGVELGQLAVVLIAWPLVTFAGRIAPPAFGRLARDGALAGLCGLGCFWFWQRAASLH